MLFILWYSYVDFCSFYPTETPFFKVTNYIVNMDFLGGSDSKESACDVEDVSLIPGLGRYPGEGNGNPLQYSCLGNPTDRGAWRAFARGVSKQSDMT